MMHEESVEPRVGRKKAILALVVLVVLSVATRLFFLSYPNQVVFDEVHFGKFVTAYCCTGEHFFDIHPPHAKLIIAAVASLGGYQGGFDFDHIGQAYGGIPVAALRMAPALAGALLPIIMYVLLRQLGVSIATAFFGGLLFVFDTAEIIQSRIIALDSILLAATFGSLSLALAAEKKRSTGVRYSFFVLAGAVAGIAVGSKFTGLSAIALLGVLTGVRMIQALKREDVLRAISTGLTMLFSALVVYAVGWMLHFSLLPAPGDGDVWQVPTGNVIQDTIKLHKIMFDANYHLDAEHPYMSPWWTWPLMQRPVFYWQSDGAYMYFIGNPVVWWGGSMLFLLAVFAYAVAFLEKRKTGKWTAVILLLAGYVIAFAPLIRVPRALFLYHYLTPLIFSTLLGLYWLDQEVLPRMSKQSRQIACSVVVIFLLGCFVLFSPLAYGKTIPDAWYASLFWFSSWR